MRLGALALVLLVSACAGYGILQTEPRQVTIEGWRFAVYVEGDRVLSRLETPVLMPNPGLVHIRAVDAIRIATGCAPDPATVSGAPGVVQARLVCP